MSRIHLSLHEARVVGCLMEKAVLTPDQCPLTLNALMVACNQKSSREPVLALDRTTVERVARDLQENCRRRCRSSPATRTSRPAS